MTGNSSVYLGTSLINCISDIMTGEVDVDRVFCILTTDQFDIVNEEAIEGWISSSKTLKAISGSPKNRLDEFTDFDILKKFQELVSAGIIVNRQHAFGHNLLDLELAALGKHWYAINLIPEDMDPAVLQAWDYFIFMEALCKDNK